MGTGEWLDAIGISCNGAPWGSLALIVIMWAVVVIASRSPGFAQHCAPAGDARCFKLKS
jgi:hypothetical protein